MNPFEEDIPVYHASSPGRLDVMGGIADYSGSLLLQMPIKQTTEITLQKRDDKKFVLQSATGKNKLLSFTIDGSEIENKSLREAGEIIRSREGGTWASYIIGCFLILQNNKGLTGKGATIKVSSGIPIGKGVSSSAALEIATMHAICKAYDIFTDPVEMAILAREVENLVVGAPCGLMDQLTVQLGRKKKLLPLICQPCTVMPAVDIPRGIEFYGIDSGTRHAVSGSSYSEVRAAAFMGYTIIAKQQGATTYELRRASESNDWTGLPYKGFLANISVNDFENKYEQLLPESITGKKFLEDHGVSIDTVTSIEPEKQYNLRVCTKHPIYENSRVTDFLEQLKHFLKSGEKKIVLQNLGKLMYQSHDSYSDVGLGNNHTDLIVQMIKQAGSSSGVYGARVTGGGCGGTVVILCYGKEGKQAAKEIFNAYKKQIKKRIIFFEGSNNGAVVLNNTHKKKL